MPFQNMQPFTFNHSDQQDAIYTEYTAQQIKALFDSRGDELRTALNLLVTALNSTEGASNIGTQSIQDVDGETIQAMLKSIRDKLKSKADGSSGADYVNATPIEGLTGETVQSLLEALKSSLDSTKTTLENSISSAIGGVKASTISADPIAVGSGNNVQAQLAWLLSQIAVAATGSIPDGSLTESKLTQALVDKINKALTNTGVLTTLTTLDKSSVVNAINEVNEKVNVHSAEYMQFKEDTQTTIGTEALPTTSQTLKGAIKEVFQSGNNVKSNTVDALLQVDNSLPISSSSQWNEIIDSISSINTKLPQRSIAMTDSSKYTKLFQKGLSYSIFNSGTQIKVQDVNDTVIEIINRPTGYTAPLFKAISENRILLYNHSNNTTLFVFDREKNLISTITLDLANSSYTNTTCTKDYIFHLQSGVFKIFDYNGTLIKSTPVTATVEMSYTTENNNAFYIQTGLTSGVYFVNSSDLTIRNLGMTWYTLPYYNFTMM